MSASPLFALIDCNNFFVSCERLFRPGLQDKPVVVLSSNDGCVIARSNEAKTLGIPMGAPAFKYREVFKRKRVVQFSANFELYGDISRRIIALLASITPRLEIYSIDEAFLDLQHLPITDFAAWGIEARTRIFRWVGVPVSIGIAPTKTLAKLASEQAKASTAASGVLTLDQRSSAPYLASTDIQHVWGIGWRLAPKLKATGLYTAQALAGLSPQYAQQLMGVRGRQIVAELNGTSCFPLQTEQKARQIIARSRTFGHDTDDFASLQSAIATFTVRASFRLRQDDQLASRIGLFLTTNRQKPGHQSWSKEVVLPQPTADTGQLIALLVRELERLYQPHTPYHRAGIWLSGLSSARSLQTDILGQVNVPAHTASQTRMAAIDTINERFGNSTVDYASTRLANIWQPLQANKSPAYTTDWTNIPLVGY